MLKKTSVFGVLALGFALAACAEGVPTFGTGVVAGNGGTGGGAGASGAAGMPAFHGQACASNGATQSCSCAGGSSGVQSCAPQHDSPTGFAFGSCGMCGGSGGSSGSGGGGSGGTGGANGNCDPATCPMPMAVIPFVPAPAACCTESGACGAVDLFGGCS